MIATCVVVLFVRAPLWAQHVLLKGELNAVGFYSTNKNDLGLARSTPRTSLGVEWGFSANPNAARHFAFESADILLRLKYDPVKRAVVPLPFDTWARFRVRRGGKDSLRVGHFQLPYGLNPVLAPRNSFILPLGAYDDIDIAVATSNGRWSCCATTAAMPTTGSRSSSTAARATGTQSARACG